MSYSNSRGGNNCRDRWNRCCNNNNNNVDPCAEEKRRCYCEGFRDGCRCAPCNWLNDNSDDNNC